MDLDDHSDRLEVVRRHEGVVCRMTAPELGPVDALLMMPAMASVGGSAYLAGVSLQLAATGLVVAALACIPLVMRRSSGSRIEVTPRWVTVSNRGLGGRVECKLNLADIERVFVAEPRDDYSGHYLVIDDGDSPFMCFAGLPATDLAFIRDLVIEAKASRERRQEREGKEYRFEQVAPEDITDLVER